MNDWDEFEKQGRQYLKAALGKDGKPSKLSNDIRYNLLALSLEKSMMAVIMFNGDLADNHTFGDLLHSLERHVYIPATIHDEITSLEQVQSICNVFEYHREMPSDPVVERMITAAEYMAACAKGICRSLKQVEAAADVR